MKRLTLLIFCLSGLFNAAAYADQDVAFTMSPESPIVVQSTLELADGRVVIGPWFYSEFKITNNTNSDVTLRYVSVICETSSFVYTRTNMILLPIRVNESYALAEYYDDLPANEAKDYTCISTMVWTNSMGIDQFIEIPFKTQ